MCHNVFFYNTCSLISQKEVVLFSGALKKYLILQGYKSEEVTTICFEKNLTKVKLNISTTI